MKKSFRKAEFGILVACCLLVYGAGESCASDLSSRLGSAVSERDPVGYIGGRGLVTQEGPTGMFINPTSGTLSEGAFTFQNRFTNQNTPAELDPFGHNFLLGYGVTDWFELGAIGMLVDLKNTGNVSSGGPYGRLRILRDEGWVPELSIGGYSQFGDDLLKKTGVFLAGYKRLPIDENGFFRALGFHAGGKQVWFDVGPDILNGYGGIELELPLDFKLIGEISTRDGDAQSTTPYSYGIQWAGEYIAFSVAAVQDGTQDRPAFFFGVGGLIESRGKDRRRSN